MTLYEFVKVVLRPSTRLLFNARVSGEEHVPEHGPLVVHCERCASDQTPSPGSGWI